MNLGLPARFRGGGVAATDGRVCQPDAAPQVRWVPVVARGWVWVPLLGCQP